jgi:cytochrome c oxidase assembly protein subunit 15
MPLSCGAASLEGKTKVPLSGAVEKLLHRPAAALPYVRLWLLAVAFLVFCMVIVGGATRLTDSGLSITEWQPLLGIIPPLSETGWQTAFEKYQLIPEYSAINKGMTLAEFKFMSGWEWAHRFLGRFIGVVFFLPFVFFAATGRMSRSLWPWLAAIFVLGGLQGALGWYMVASGLVDRVDVSQYRLAAHLSLAALIFSATLWMALGLGTARGAPAGERERAALLIVVMVFLQIAAGGFVAGLDAGQGYNTWPLMNDKLVPDGLFVMQPFWRNIFENAMTVQFNHRLLAYMITVFVAGYAYVVRTKEAVLLGAAVLAQVAFGIWALLWQVPLWLGLVHQAGAFIVLAAALWNLHCVLFREVKSLR